LHAPGETPAGAFLALNPAVSAFYAYRRGDALAKRAVLMDAWGMFCVGDKLEMAEAA
jgi:hypothetical protein